MQAAARKVCLAAGRADTAAVENGSKSRRRNMSEEKVTLSDGKEAARQQILDLVAEYCDKYHNQKKEFTEGQRIPYASRVYDNHEMVNLVDSALEFWLTSGRYTDQFEAGLAKYLGVKYCSLVNSGSSANLIAFMALTSPLLGERRVRRGDEIITVAAGFPTTVTPAIQYGAVPVFVDVTIPQYNIDADKLEAALSEKTKAVMIAHTLPNVMRRVGRCIFPPWRFIDGLQRRIHKSTSRV